METAAAPPATPTTAIDVEQVAVDKTTTKSPCRLRYVLAVAVLVALVLIPTLVLSWYYVWRSETTVSPDEGYLWSGYGCDVECARGDVNYEIEARLATYTLAGGGAAPGFTAGQDPTMYTRTFVGTSGTFCSGPDGLPYDGSTGPLGPCLQVQPGQTLTIKLVNKMEGGMAAMEQHVTSNEDYWQQATQTFQDGTAAAGTDDIRVGPTAVGPLSGGWFSKPPATAAEMEVTNLQDLPGRDVSFDAVNLHFHGLQVVPHLFYPQGTSAPSAPWISVLPGECFCYVLTIPEDHPSGTFFWHIHRHGSVAMQAWQGMVGEIQIGGNASVVGSYNYELAAQGVTRSLPFFTWEWATRATTNANGYYTEGQFIDGGGALQTFPLNNAYRPSYTVQINEPLHLRFVCAQTTTGSALYILDSSDNIVDMHIFASDGISYGAVYTKKMLVVGVGQRQGVLIQFPAAGTYRVMQGIVNDFQSTPTAGGPTDYIGPDVPNSTDTPVAYFIVSGAYAGAAVNLSALTFTPGGPIPGGGTIAPANITSQLSLNFQVQSNLKKMPAPQFIINGKEFDYKDIATQVASREFSQWTLTSNMNYYHPFHIHVNPFIVKSSISAYQIGGSLFQQAVGETGTVPPNQWRDTVLIPPYGNVIIWQQFGSTIHNSWSGKTVFHCHFLDHEDQGMIRAFMIA